MTSKHYRWQTRWRVDLAAGRLMHSSGFIVEVRPGGELAPVNRGEIIAALAGQHGGHNAPVMVRRLEREARDLWRPARGRRGGGVGGEGGGDPL